MQSSENVLLEKVNLHLNALLLEVKSQFSPVNKNLSLYIQRISLIDLQSGMMHVTLSVTLVKPD